MTSKTFVAAVLGLSVLCFVVLAVILRRTEPEKVSPPAAVTESLIRPHSPVKGPQSAPVTIVEFLDPECESCRAMHPIVKDLLAEYRDRVRLVIRYVPLHGSSVLAASALEEARELGKYDEALDILFENQPVWGSHQDPKPELIATYLASIGIDAERLKAEYLIPKHRWKIDQDRTDAAELGVRATPEFFVNGVRLSRLGYQPLKEAIEIALSMASKR